MRARKSLFAAVLAGALATATSASAKDYKIGYSVFWGTNPFLVTMVNGAKKAVGRVEGERRQHRPDRHERRR